MPTPAIPEWVPPLDTGQPAASELNALGTMPKATVAARHAIIPICYGRDRFFGMPAVVHVDDVGGFLYVAYTFCEGPIQGFETALIDGVDVNDAAGFLSHAGAQVELHTGTAVQTTSTLLSGVLSGYIDTLANTAYIVIKAPQNSTRGFPRMEAIVQGKKVFDPRRYNTLYDDNSDPQFVNAADTDITTAQWFITSAEATPIGSDSWTAETADPSPASATYTEIIDNDDNNQPMVSKEIPVDVLKDYTVTLYAKQPSGDRRSYLGVEFLDANGDLIGSASSPVSDATGWGAIGDYHYHSVVNTTFPASWTRYQFDFGPSVGADATMPTGVVAMRIHSLFCRDGAVGTATTIRVSDYRIHEGLKATEQVEATIATHVYSQNPAVCFRDMIVNHTGWGIFDQGVADLANYNEEFVDGIQRRQIGLTLGKATTVEKWAAGFRTYMGAFLGWEAGKIRVVPNRADVIVQGGVFMDGTASTWITMGDAAELEFSAAQDFSFEFSFKTGATMGAVQFIAGKKAGTAAGTAGYAAYLTATDTLEVIIDDGTNEVVATDTLTNYFDGEWHHVGVSIDQTLDVMILYTDDILRQAPSIAAVTATLVNAQDFRLGSNGAGTELADIVLDEVRVWDEIRTANDFADNRFNEITPEAALVGYWDLNDGVGATTAVDSSFSGNDGTPSGGVVFGLGYSQVIPANVVMHIDPDNIVKDSLRVTRRSMRDVPNSVIVDYEDSSGAKWTTERVQKDSSRVSSGAEQRRLSRITLPGIHNASQAQREATERLNWYLTDLDITLSLFDEGWNLQHGSIVAVTHPIGLDGKLMRVTRLQAESGRWTVDLSEYDPAIYSNEVIVDPTTPDTSLGNPLNPPAVSNLALAEELFTYKNGLTGSRVRATWDATAFPFLAQYLVEGYVGGVKVFQTLTNSVNIVTPSVEELVSLVAVTYEVRVSVQSPFATGPETTEQVDILGKLAVPGNVPTLTLTQLSADSVRLTWGEAIDIDIWRYEVRVGATTDVWAAATLLELVDGLNYTADGLGSGAVGFFVKARDSVGNESVDAIQANITLSVPPAVTSVFGFEVASEVRLNWPAPTSGFVERYRIAYDTVPSTGEISLDIVDTLRFQTKDVPEGVWQFLVYARDKNGVEAATAPFIEIEVTSDADAFLADTYDFVQATTATPTIVTNGSLTNMVEYALRLTTSKLYVTNMADVFLSSPSDFNTFSAEPLANYHSTGASEWLSEAKDFGLQLTGSWNLSHNVTALNGNVIVALELSTDNVTYTPFIGAARGVFRYARVKITTTNPPGDDTAFVKSPLMNLRINVVPLEESGADTSSGTEGTGKVIQLTREYSALKEIVTQVKNNVDGLASVVDNIIIGPNTSIQCDGTNYALGGDWAEFDFGTGDFTIEFWTKHTGDAGQNENYIVKRNGVLEGFAVRADYLLNEIKVVYDDGTTTVTSTTTGDALPNDGDQHHIAVTFDRTADEIRIYSDAVLAGGSPFDISTVTGSISNASNMNLFADSGGTAIADLNGVIDELRIWSDVRTPTEITDNYDTELDMTTTHAGLVGYWRMNGVTGDTVGGGTLDDILPSSTNHFTDTGAGDLTYVDSGASNPVQRINSFDVYVFDTFGQQQAEEFQWKWKAV